MSDWLKSTDEYIGKYKAIKNRKTGELALCGVYGEIWIYSDSPRVYSAVITSATIGNRIGPKFGLKEELKVGDEFVIKFDESQFEMIYKKLKIAKKVGTQVKYAEAFGKR